MIGEVIGSYRVVSQLGAGGMGAVYLGEHAQLGSRVAIKVLLPAMSTQQKMVDRFLDEARAAARIQDPGIVTVFDSGWHTGCAYIVMEYLTGRTLTQRLGHARLAPVQAVRLIQQCAITMAAAHARGIVHRDLKPDNIFVIADPAMPGGERTKILDFGIAKLIDDEGAQHGRTQTGVIMGTPAYMSPEQCRGAGEVDHRTDVYALGCVLFHLLCGRPPFIAPTPGDMIASHLTAEPPAPSSLAPEVTPEIDAIVRRCLAKRADDRFQSMTELVRAGAVITGDNLSIETIPPLRASSQGNPTVATQPPTTRPGFVPVADTTLRGSTGETAPPPPSRRWRGAVVLALACAAAGGTVAVIATRGGGTSQPVAQPAPPAPPVPPPVVPVDAALPVVTRSAPTDASVPAGKPSHVQLQHGTVHRAGSGSGSAGYDPYADR